MPKYQVSIIERPAAWEPVVPDDVPDEPGVPLEILAQADDLFAAVRQAIQFNEEAQRGNDRRWAVVVEPGSAGRTWRHARLCTPLRYKVASIWWPGGWEPNSPLDVPNCLWQSQAADTPQMTYSQALATVRGLNQQSIDHAARMWYVIVAVENELISQTISCDAAGTETTVEVRRLHVVRPEDGSGHGDCSHCPARSFPCAQEDWIHLEQTLRTNRVRSLASES